VLCRECAIAFAILLAFLFGGEGFLKLMHLSNASLQLSGGIVLFLIALRMVFPGEGALSVDSLEGEPFLVPLAVPLLAGPSTLAAILLLQRSAPSQTVPLLFAITIAWALSAGILLSSTLFYRVLRERGLIAIERLMGMLLVMVAVQMLLNGVKAFLAR